eukprot:TRINITY_DN17684_c0_g2_i7.p1 TRINITY_DN17684_c0_g2~~TRINITY_DN17684_c0_g2_i7.p1  ORF type:complete len:339 (-),score=46.96 TRINITY_DN17684_c0_g2_i7:107-1123(-)
MPERKERNIPDRRESLESEWKEMGSRQVLPGGNRRESLENEWKELGYRGILDGMSVSPRGSFRGSLDSDISNFLNATETRVRSISVDEQPEYSLPPSGNMAAPQTYHPHPATPEAAYQLSWPPPGGGRIKAQDNLQATFANLQHAAHHQASRGKANSLDGAQSFYRTGGSNMTSMHTPYVIQTLNPTLQSLPPQQVIPVAVMPSVGGLGSTGPVIQTTRGDPTWPGNVATIVPNPQAKSAARDSGGWKRQRHESGRCKSRRISIPAEDIISSNAVGGDLLHQLEHVALNDGPNEFARQSFDADIRQFASVDKDPRFAAPGEGNWVSCLLYTSPSPRDS